MPGWKLQFSLLTSFKLIYWSARCNLSLNCKDGQFSTLFFYTEMCNIFAIIIYFAVLLFKQFYRKSILLYKLSNNALLRY